MGTEILYNATPTLQKFHLSNAFYRIIMGPVGSGKSTGNCFEIFKRAVEQAPDSRGIRKTRFAIIRNVYRELLDTTMNTWTDWFPEADFGRINYSDMEQTLIYDRGDVHVVSEILFRALDKPQDVRKLLSLELTGAWINEIREVPKLLVDTIGDRVGRYPARRDGGCTWRGVIGDTNMPDTDHWIYHLAEEEPPELWEFFKQPGGLVERDGKFYENPEAENIENLEPHYYHTRMHGKSLEHIRVYYCAQYGFVMDGKPVIPEYVDAVHAAREVITPSKFSEIYIGLDFGLTPAALFAQRLGNGQIVWIDELVSEDMGAVAFGEELKRKLLRDYRPWLESRLVRNPCGDPAGDDRAQTDERTPFQIINEALKPLHLKAKPAHTNDFTIRREAIAGPLTRMVDGKPGLVVSPKCAVARKGLSGGYCYKRKKVSGNESYHDVPDKGKYSHVVDAGGYAMLDMGEGRLVIGRPSSAATRRDRPVSEIMRTAVAVGEM